MVSYHKKSRLKLLTEGMKGYVAGLIDGEGCIVISKCNRYRLGLNCWISIANTSLELMNWLVENVGGKAYSKNPRQEPLLFNGRVCERLPCYNWNVNATIEVNELLSQIIPFLVIKKEKAQKCIEITSQKLAMEMEEAKHYLINNPEIQKERDSKYSKGYYQKHKEQCKERSRKNRRGKEKRREP